MLFDPDDDDTLTKERFLSVFKLQEEEQEETAPEDTDENDDHVHGTNPTGGTAGTEKYVCYSFVHAWCNSILALK
jgi:hypothetical protein